MQRREVTDLFGPGQSLIRPRQKRRVLMHVFDSGDCHTGAAEDLGKPMCRMFCQKCGAETDWIVFDTVTEAKRGIPCGKCNGGQ